MNFAVKDMPNLTGMVCVCARVCVCVCTWFMNLAVKDMPNLTGMAASPRFFQRFSRLKASAAARLPNAVV